MLHRYNSASCEIDNQKFTNQWYINKKSSDIIMLACIVLNWRSAHAGMLQLNHTGLNMIIKSNPLMITVKLLLTISMTALLASCSTISISNPFGANTKEQSRTPQNATAYVCEGNKRFYVRMQNHGNDAWLIYPDHEVNLTRTQDNSNRFSSGVIVLVINGAETTLNDGEKIAYTACKPQ